MTGVRRYDRDNKVDTCNKAKFREEFLISNNYLKVF